MIPFQEIEEYNEEKIEFLELDKNICLRLKKVFKDS